ncbi:unnamed protein product [Calicophoron daubneyi]|uniref:Uncharacterized protein n=1 Tax=Calicophoron daubneyi TaxID=300641 RepID=A0AAV2TFN1_CALDB
MHRHLASYGSPCLSEQREYVKLQYGRKIAQDTCMLASMKTPDWSQAPPGFIGRHSAVPCTVTTNSGSSNLKMYPYSVYSCACHPDPHRCSKVRGDCTRHRCLSGSAIHVVLPSSSNEASANRSVMRSQILDATGRSGSSIGAQPMALSNLAVHPSMTKLTAPRPNSHVYHHHHHSSQSHQQLQHQQPVSCMTNQNVGGAQLLSNYGFQPAMQNTSHHRVMLNQEMLQRH